MNVLAFGAHPDDIELQCAGTLINYANAGHRIFMACASNGDMGHMHIPPRELAQIRKKETCESAKLIGAEVIWLDIGGPVLHDDDATRLMVIDAIRNAKPDVMITHHPDDYHDNHRSISKLVRDSIFQASLPNVATDYEPIRKFPSLYYMDNFTGLHFTPTCFVNISESIDLKKKMLETHQSQMEWLRYHNGNDIVEQMITTARYRGYQVGVPYAEAFMSVMSYPLVRAGNMLT